MALLEIPAENMSHLSYPGMGRIPQALLGNNYAKCFIKISKYVFIPICQMCNKAEKSPLLSHQMVKISYGVWSNNLDLTTI